MRIPVIVFVLGCVSCAIAVTTVENCPQGRSLDEQHGVVSIGRCKKTPCKLKKGKVVDVAYKFTADRDVDKITHTVNAIIAGIPFPFIGVDGTDVCQFIYESDAKTKAGCPLKAGKDYIYENKFEVLQIYPTLRLSVHWGLTAGDGKDVACFQVPARIVD